VFTVHFLCVCAHVHAYTCLSLRHAVNPPPPPPFSFVLQPPAEETASAGRTTPLSGVVSVFEHIALKSCFGKYLYASQLLCAMCAV